MKYNFDEIVDRKNTDSLKWSPEVLSRKFGDEDVLPMWIADMDFRTAKPIIEALRDRVEHGIFGYCRAKEDFYQSCVHWQKNRNGWKIEKEWILFSPGVVPALEKIVGMLCKPKEKVIIQSPVYYPFFRAITDNNCVVADNTLIEYEGKYEIDFQNLEELAKDSNTTLMILCNPQNPVGCCWSEHDLRKIGEICFRNHIIVVVDEIHGDLVYKPNRHISFGSLGKEFLENSIVCTAPSKTFNIAGLQVSDIIVANERLREKIRPAFKDMPNSFATVAQIAAYTEGEAWLEEMLRYVEENLKYIDDFVERKMPRVKFRKPEATYLAWLDFRDYGIEKSELDKLMGKTAGVALDAGYIFGDMGEGFQRINAACPRTILEQGMVRIERALKNWENRGK